jgi:DNA repair protein RecO (recombination protein O)
MSETYPTTAIILKRRPFKEDDISVVLYSLEKGKIELVARGAKKISSKMSAHLEPLTLSRVMVAQGKHYDYAASAASERCYPGIKSDLSKLASAGRLSRIFNRLVKDRVPDRKIFELICDILDGLDCAKTGPSANICGPQDLSIFKLLTLLGFAPELKLCARCRREIGSEGNAFDLSAGSVVCRRCRQSQDKLSISADAIKALRYTARCERGEFMKLSLTAPAQAEVHRLVGLLVEYAG